jgi:hypothetical protein
MTGPGKTEVILLKEERLYKKFKFFLGNTGNKKWLGRV